jgi:hypothetical protein
MPSPPDGASGCSGGSVPRHALASLSVSAWRRKNRHSLPMPTAMPCSANLVLILASLMSLFHRAAIESRGRAPRCVRSGDRSQRSGRGSPCSHQATPPAASSPTRGARFDRGENPNPKSRVSAFDMSAGLRFSRQLESLRRWFGIRFDSFSSESALVRCSAPILSSVA